MPTWTRRRAPRSVQLNMHLTEREADELMWLSVAADAPSALEYVRDLLHERYVEFKRELAQATPEQRAEWQRQVEEMKAQQRAYHEFRARQAEQAP